MCVCLDRIAEAYQPCLRGLTARKNIEEEFRLMDVILGILSEDLLYRLA